MLGLELFVFNVLNMITFALLGQSVDLQIDMTPFFEQLNQWLPTFVQIFGIIGGISGALFLSKMIIGAVVNAFRGGGL